MKIRLVAIGDIHTGSIYALAPLSSVSQDKRNAFLEWIFECWTDFCQKYKGPDYLLLIGDLADGSQLKTHGVDAHTTNTDDQVKMAIELLSMITKPKTKVYGVNGSGYHGGEGQATNIDKRVTEGLGGKYKGDILECDIGRELIQVSHGGTGSLVNPSTYIQREIRLSKEDAQKRKVKGPTILLRGHQHRFYMIQDDAGVVGILNGCWQYLTPFMTKKSANVTPSFGATIIDIEDGIAKPYRVEYTLPEKVRQSMIGYESLIEDYHRKLIDSIKNPFKQELKEKFENFGNGGEKKE